MTVTTAWLLALIVSVAWTLYLWNPRAEVPLIIEPSSPWWRDRFHVWHAWTMVQNGYVSASERARAKARANRQVWIAEPPKTYAWPRKA